MKKTTSKRHKGPPEIAPMMAADARLSFFLYAVFYFLLISALVYIFYSSPLRERIENRFYDIRTQLAPKVTGVEYATIIGITEQNIKALDGNEAKDLSYASLIKIVNAGLASEASSVVVLLASQVFSYDDPGLIALAAIAKKDHRLLIGVFGVGKDSAQLPVPLQEIRSQVVTADFERTYRLNVIRTVRVATSNSENELQPLPLYFASSINPKSAERLFSTAGILGSKAEAEFLVNWRGQPIFPEIDAEELVNKGSNPLLKNRIAIIGYEAFRPSGINHREATFLNSPWQSDGDELKNGVPVVKVVATGLYNILEESWLRPVHPSIPIVQTIVVSLLALTSWYFGSGIAAFSFLAGWFLLTYIHGILFTTANIYIPIADSLLFSCLATTIGGLWRIRIEAQLQAVVEAQEHSEHQIAQVQDRFLDRFANELSTLNERVRQLLGKHRNLALGTGTVQKIYSKAIGSSDELAEYLDGIRQFASTRNIGNKRPEPKKFLIEPLLAKVLRQFDTRKLEAGVDLAVRTQFHGKAIYAEADPTLTSQILYNLISNAIKYSPKGSKVEVILTSNETNMAISVRDKGPGIATEFHERVFEKFYRIKDDYVYKVKGHGLGLYLSRYFADKMGARIEIKSSPGAGSEFTLHLVASSSSSEDLA